MICDNPPMLTQLLGGLSPRQFIEEYWQKKPLLIRQAVPDFKGLITPEALFDLACDEDVESRYVRRHEGQWTIAHGPQKRAALRGRKSPWTVLVQGLNLWLPEADELLHRFHFIPQARLDDLMVSYAVDGGGVGPHFDNYDVFLLQGIGQRRWRIGDQADRSLVEDAPLKILRDFQPTQEWVLDAGDMLYLPPHWAHDGVAIGECMTYSIGFRSPSAQELGAGFLAWLEERLCLDGIYSDPDLAPQDNSAEISTAMIDQVQDMISRIQWRRDDVAAFLGSYLTEPKPHVFFEPPEPALSAARFRDAVKKSGFRLDARTLLLMAEGRFYLNGEALDIPASEHAVLAQLADQRHLESTVLTTAATEILYEWYLDGFGTP